METVCFLEKCLVRVRKKLHEKELEASFLQGKAFELQEIIEKPDHKMPLKIQGSIKRLVYDAAASAFPDGVTAALICKKFAQQGIVLQRGTISSVLSRYKLDGVLEYDGESYRTKPCL